MRFRVLVRLRPQSILDQERESSAIYDYAKISEVPSCESIGSFVMTMACVCSCFTVQVKWDEDR